MVTALGIGFITPPLGLNLFVVSGVTQVPVVSISRYVLPFVLMMIVVVILIGYFPQISLIFLN
jgi:TRAP-type C4-dicarboxylate transport system permease large subunit